MESKALDIICIIPARGGSKRILRKNILPLAGIPTLAWSVIHAVQSELVGTTYVSTDDDEIGAVALRYGAQVVPRPVDLSNDTASSESALLHVLDWRRAQGMADPDLVVFLQATSPVRKRGEIDGAIRHLTDGQYDSVWSACENTRFIWGLNKAGDLYPFNYDYKNRKREQDLDRQFRENGSIFVFKPWLLREQNNRMGGRMGVFEQDYWASFQIDTPEHVDLIDWILRTRPEYQVEPQLTAALDLVVFDFDGVMTDNSVQVDQNGSESVRCNRGDGWGIARLRERGMPMMVLSTEENPVVAARCAKLKLPCHHGIGDKGAYLGRYLAENGIDPARVAFVGNDVNDLGCLEQVGFPVAVADAHPRVLAMARVVLAAKGGEGAVREFCDRLLACLPA